MLKKKIEQNKRIIFWALGIIFLFLAIIGILLPLLPTTPFLILAAFCFSRSSEKYHNWLRNHNIAGPVIRNWEDYGAISKKSKIVSVTMMILLMSYTIAEFNFSIYIKLAAILMAMAATFFILTRPSK